MPSPSVSAGRREALAGLRAALAAGHGSAAPESFTPADEGLVRSGLGDLDTALGGGFPRGIIATLEGAPGSGRSALAARLLAVATGHGLAALVEAPAGAEGSFYPPALAAAGVDLERLLVVPAENASGIARATDILLRAAVFGVVVLPAIALSATAWTRLASLAHRAGALVIALGDASDELRYFATLRVQCRAARVRFAGTPAFSTRWSRPVLKRPSSSTSAPRPANARTSTARASSARARRSSRCTSAFSSNLPCNARSREGHSRYESTSSRCAPSRSSSCSRCSHSSAAFSFRCASLPPTSLRSRRSNSAASRARTACSGPTRSGAARRCRW